MCLKSTILSAGVVFALVNVGGARAADILVEPTVPAPLAAAPSVQLSVIPYVWMAGIDGNIAIASARRPGATVTSEFSASFGDVISQLDGIPFMGAADVRFGRFSLAFDLMYTPLQQDFSTRDVLFDGGSAALKNTIAAAFAFYRIYEDQAVRVDVGGGVRYYEFRTTLNLNPGLLPAESASKTFSWTDPVVAGRVRFALPHQFALSVEGDIGGFGAGSEQAWQVTGTIDYGLTPNIDLRLGYRYLSIDDRTGPAQVDLNFHGPILAANIRC